MVGIENEPLGIVSIAEAMRQAEEAEVDLVEIAPTAKPPVVRLMDYGKFKYRESKKAHEAKLKQKQIQVKEVKFRPGTDEGDYKIKVRNLTRFLTEGDKTKVTLRFRGREMAHQELGHQMLQQVIADLAEIATPESIPRSEGRTLVMIMLPKAPKVPGQPATPAAAPGASPAGAAQAAKPADKPKPAPKPKAAEPKPEPVNEGADGGA